MIGIYSLSVSEDDVKGETEDGKNDANDGEYLSDDRQWEGNGCGDMEWYPIWRYTTCKSS